MERLAVLLDQSNRFPDAIAPCGTEVPALIEQYTQVLQQAEASGTDTVYFRSVPMCEVQSTNFAVVYGIWRAIVPFQRQHQLPHKVCIVCDDAAAASLYCQVYNF